MHPEIKYAEFAGPETNLYGHLFMACFYRGRAGGGSKIFTGDGTHTTLSTGTEKNKKTSKTNG